MAGMSASTRHESKLIRNIGFWGLMGIAVGQIIGAGIMSLTGVAIGMTGTGVALAFMISPFLTLITNGPITFLSSAVPTTGGPYRYVSRLLGKKFGFLYIVIHVLTNLTIALYALGFASYFVSIVSGVDAQLVAILILIIFYIVNLIGAKQAAILNTLVCIIMISGIGLFIGYGIPQANPNFVFDSQNMFTGGLSGFVGTLALLSFATGGAQVIAEMGGEIKDPAKNIPFVMIVSTLGVGILYAFMAVVAAGVLPIEQVANKPLTDVARAIMPTAPFYFFVICAALGATASTLNATLSWVSKSVLIACEDGLLPRWLASVNDRGIPYKILTLYFLVGMYPLVSGHDIAFVSRLGTANSLLGKLLVGFAFTKVAEKYPQQVAAAKLKLGASASKKVGYFCMAMLLILSSSLILALPTYAIISFFVILILTFGYVNIGLKGVEIPDDLAIDYTTGNK